MTQIKCNQPAAPIQADPHAGSGNSITFTNDGDSDALIRFTANYGDAAIPDMVLKPGESRTVSFPHGWGGNFRKMTGNPADPVTLGEVKFNGWQNQTFYDVSYIEGYNTPMVIKPGSGGGETAGDAQDLMATAPEWMKQYNGNGELIALKKTWDGGSTADHTNPQILDFYRKYISAQNNEGYLFPKDDDNTVATGERQLHVTLG